MFKQGFVMTVLCSSMLLAGCRDGGEADIADSAEQDENQQEQTVQEEQAPASDDGMEEAEATLAMPRRDREDDLSRTLGQEG